MIKDRDHPFFRPLWRRIAIVAFCAAWTGWEYYNGEELWVTITFGMTLYAIWTYLYAYREPKEPDAEPTPPPTKPGKD